MKEMTPKRQMKYTNCNTAAEGPANGQDGGSEPTPKRKEYGEDLAHEDEGEE
jgi:hypothetical protein